MRAAHHLASQSLPDYSCKFSRRDFTLPQLFACLVVKEQMRRSYRGAEALLRDCEHWLRDIGLRRAPDHNTLCRAAAFLLRRFRVRRLLDQLVRWAAAARLLGLSTHPLAIDSTTYESHHVSRHYERRCHQTRQRMRAGDAKRGRKTTRSETVKSLPKLGIGVATRCHLVLSAWTGTGAGADQPHFEPPGGACRTRPSRRRPTPATTASSTTSSPAATWASAASSRRAPAARPGAAARPAADGAAT
jgi:hypothetical protein